MLISQCSDGRPCISIFPNLTALIVRVESFYAHLPILIMLKRKLHALDYPQNGIINTNDEKELRRVVVWLEENIIKKCSSKTRENLRNVESSEWNKAFDDYKKVLGIYTGETVVEQVNSIASYAVKLDYVSKKNVYEKNSVETIEVSHAPSVVTENPLDRLDFTTQEFREGISAIAKILNILNHPDPLITLKAISQFVCKRLNKQVLDNPSNFVVKGTPFPYENVNFNANLTDASLKEASKILHLIYIQNLRDLQTKVNEFIVKAQSITADPKTNTKLGKVGI